MLTDARLRKIKPNTNKKSPDKYTDTNGLQLHVFPTGRMTWIYAYRYQDKQRSLTLGSYPDVSLADARIKLSESKKTLNDGIDPNQAKKEQKQFIDESTLFKTLAMEWMDSRKDVIKEPTYKRDLSVFEKDLFPMLGNRPIDQIKGKDVLEAVKKIEDRGAGEMAKRAIPLAGRVFRYAIRKGLIENDPTPHLHEALKPRKVKNMARLDISEFPSFLQRMDKYHGNILIKSALQFMTLTFVRTAELRNMEWSELDLDAKEWRIPADKMKMALPHIVPLSKQAIEILEALQPLTGNNNMYSITTVQPNH